MITMEGYLYADACGGGTYASAGKLWGQVDARPGDGDAPKVMLSELGSCHHLKEEIPKIHKYYPQVEVWRVCIMPDHIHLIVRVKEDLRRDKLMESHGTEARGDRLRL